ncbi:hypothetical protein L1987_22724 [Smallanthus sonchifolius]|uniref:Uncharacterized protein n=1 Tax=Smallanthus sonchifolius TaxID=185202 RepID=A0ACB9IFU9_9ASTR|nr:hypothetical protein L1987_22724 [Smallanthus sonchifolius]
MITSLKNLMIPIPLPCLQSLTARDDGGTSRDDDETERRFVKQRGEIGMEGIEMIGNTAHSSAVPPPQ